MSPVEVTDTVPLPLRLATRSDRFTLTERSGIPSPSASPIELGPPASTSTSPLKRMEDTSMSLGESGGVGSKMAVTHLPLEFVLRTPGSRVSTISALHSVFVYWMLPQVAVRDLPVLARGWK